MNEELEQIVNVDHLIKEFMVQAVGAKVDGQDEPQWIHTYTPTADQLKLNPDLTASKYLQLILIKKPKAGDKFASFVKQNVEKFYLVNESNPAFRPWAEDILKATTGTDLAERNKYGSVLESSKETDAPILVLKDTVNLILDRIGCRPSYIKRKDGTYMESSYNVKEDDKLVPRKRKTIIDSFSMIFHPDDYANLTVRRGLIAKEKQLHELWPVSPDVVIGVSTADAEAEVPQGSSEVPGASAQASTPEDVTLKKTGT